LSTISATLLLGIYVNQKVNNRMGLVYPQAWSGRKDAIPVQFGNLWQLGGERHTVCFEETGNQARRTGRFFPASLQRIHLFCLFLLCLTLLVSRNWFLKYPASSIIFNRDLEIKSHCSALNLLTTRDARDFSSRWLSIICNLDWII
jgi:hypothetical protein